MSMLTLTGTVLGSRTTDNYMYIDRNLRSTPAFTLSNEANRPVFVAASTIDAQGRTLNANALANPQLGRVLELTNVGEATRSRGDRRCGGDVAARRARGRVVHVQQRVRQHHIRVLLGAHRDDVHRDQGRSARSVGLVGPVGHRFSQQGRA